MHDADGGEVLRFRFTVIKVWELDVALLMAERALGLLPLVPFARDARPPRVREAMKTLSRVEDLQRRADLQGALAVFAGNAFPAIDWAATIPLELLVKSTFYDRLKAMAFEEVSTKVREEERLELLTRLLRGRLGRGASRWVKVLSSADGETIDALVDALAVVWTKDEYLATLERVLGSARAPRRPTRRASPAKPRAGSGST